MFVFYLLVSGVVALVVWYLVTWWQGRSKYPPGPTPLPLVGNMLAVRKYDKFFYYLNDVKATYGDIYTIYMGTTPTVVINSMELLREAFLQKQNDFAGRTLPYSSSIFSKNGTDIIVGDFTKTWRQQRKIAHSAIRKFATGDNLGQLIEQSAEKVFDVLDHYAESGEEWEPTQVLALLIYNIINAMLAGQICELDDPVLTDFLAKLKSFEEYGAVLPGDVLPILKYIPFKSHTRFKALFDDWHRHIDNIYEEHLKTYDEDNVTDLAYHVIHAAREMEREEGHESLSGLTLDHYKLILMDVFIAGNDTSRTTMHWCMLYLSAFPQIQKKMQKEMDEVLGDSPITIEHHKHLPYCEAFLHEVLRLRPPAPFGVPHKTTCDTSVGGYSIPKGTQVLPGLWSIHMNEKEWGDPEAFRPERFLDEEGKMKPRSYSWLPFSTGRRVCVGESLAKAEIHLSLAHLARRYNFSPPPGILLTSEIQRKGEIMTPKQFKIIVQRRKMAN